MTERNYTALKEYFQATYLDNSYVKVLEMKLVHIEPVRVRLSMPINVAKHTNL